MEAAANDGNLDAGVEANQRFHEGVLRGSGSPVLQRHFELLVNQFRVPTSAW